jgi:hypothetical protein
MIVLPEAPWRSRVRMALRWLGKMFMWLLLMVVFMSIGWGLSSLIRYMLPD